MSYEVLDRVEEQVELEGNSVLIDSNPGIAVDVRARLEALQHVVVLLSSNGQKTGANPHRQTMHERVGIDPQQQTNLERRNWQRRLQIASYLRIAVRHLGTPDIAEATYDSGAIEREFLAEHTDIKRRNNYRRTLEHFRAVYENAHLF